MAGDARSVLLPPFGMRKPPGWVGNVPSRTRSFGSAPRTGSARRAEGLPSSATRSGLTGEARKRFAETGGRELPWRASVAAANGSPRWRRRKPSPPPPLLGATGASRDRQDGGVSPAKAGGGNPGAFRLTLEGGGESRKSSAQALRPARRRRGYPAHGGIRTLFRQRDGRTLLSGNANGSAESTAT